MTTLYSELKSDTSLMYMGDATDALYQDFYAEEAAGNIEKIAEIEALIKDNQDSLAMLKNAELQDQKQIDYFRKQVNEIYLTTFANGIYDFTQTQESALSAVANLPAYAGGDAVYTARVMLNIDPLDIGVDYAKPPQNKPQITKENPVKVFPNPASSQLTIAFSDIISKDAVIEIYGNMGNLIMSETLHAGNYTKAIDISKLNAGLYFFSISINGTKVSSGKLTILNK
jgi:hypothetical protein